MIKRLDLNDGLGSDRHLFHVHAASRLIGDQIKILNGADTTGIWEIDSNIIFQKINFGGFSNGKHRITNNN